jgi:hypothetical protein
VVVSGHLFKGNSIKSINIVVVKFPDDDSFISGSRNEEGRVFSVFGGVSGLETGDPSVVSGQESFIIEFGISVVLGFHFGLDFIN